MRTAQAKRQYAHRATARLTKEGENMPIQDEQTSRAFLGIVKNLPITREGIVSKVPFETKNMQVSVFSVAAGQEISEHTSPKAVVVTLISGALNFTVGQAVHHMVAGDFIYLAPNEPHALSACEDSRVQLVMFSAK
ncbi:cupin domain protein [Fannyhessea vaginae]|nr:cupin domain protein [Fannyhessea vaginae]